MATSKQDPVYVNTFFARQPIFTPDKIVWGYELLYRDSEQATKAVFTDRDVATLSVISSVITNPPVGKDVGKKIFIHFTERSILQGIPQALAKETTVVEIEAFQDKPDLLFALEDLKEAGYLVALDEFDGRVIDEELVQLADIVFLDVLINSREELAQMVEALAEYDCMLAAKRVESPEHFAMAAELGFSLFQGFFFEKPENVPSRTLSSNQVSRLALMRSMESDNPDFEELAKVIQSDVSLSYRLLAFINSAAFGIPRKVESIRQAIVLLGWKQIKRWLWLVILSDVVPRGKTSELPFMSAIRGKFLESTAQHHPEAKIPNPDTLFMLGLFSLLNAILDTTFEDIVANLPLEEELTKALCGHDSPLTDWLHLAKAFESGEWGEVDVIARKYGLEPMNIAAAYSEALVWARSFYDNIDEAA
jgi:EAL and modified HD-GYP domain-containing signal transduction protein